MVNELTPVYIEYIGLIHEQVERIDHLAYSLIIAALLIMSQGNKWEVRKPHTKKMVSGLIATMPLVTIMWCTLMIFFVGAVLHGTLIDKVGDITLNTGDILRVQDLLGKDSAGELAKSIYIYGLLVGLSAIPLAIWGMARLKSLNE